MIEKQQLSAETLARIEAEANAYHDNHRAHGNKLNRVNGYIAGATAEALKNKACIEALEKIDEAPIPHNQRQMESWIDTARGIAREVLNNIKQRVV